MGASFSSAHGAALDEALLVYADGLVAQRAAMTCPPPVADPTEAEAWEKGRSILLATLWANNVADETVRGVADRLSAEPSAPDCADALFLEMVRGVTEDWPTRMGRMLSQLGFTVIAEPPTAAQWDAVMTVIDEEKAAQGRLLTCIAVRYAELLPGEVKSWDDLVAETGQLLASKGFARDQVAALMQGVSADAIWIRFTGDAAAAQKADCDANPDWYERWSLFGQFSLKSKVTDILEGTTP